MSLNADGVDEAAVLEKLMIAAYVDAREVSLTMLDSLIMSGCSGATGARA